MVLTGTIYTSDKESFILDALPDIKKDINRAKNCTVGDIKIVEFDVPRNVPTRTRVRNGVEYIDIDWDWLKRNYPPQGNFVCWHIDRRERDRIGLTHSSGTGSLAGRYNRNIGDNSMEFIVITDKSVKRFVHVFLHELSHGFSHWTNVADRTHAFEDAGKWIGDIFATYDFTTLNTLTELVAALTKKRDLLIKESERDTVTERDTDAVRGNMENPEYLITHHGADARVLTLDEMRRIYQATHHESLYKRFDQPRSSGPYPDIAYHILVGSDGWAYQRDLDVFGYHASNYQVNINAIAIVISGNYDRDTLSPEMEQYYREAVADVKQKLASLKYCNGHRAYTNTKCPGDNITDTFIKSVFENPLPEPPVVITPPDNSEELKQHVLNATNSISDAVSELSLLNSKL